VGFLSRIVLIAIEDIQFQAHSSGIALWHPNPITNANWFIPSNTHVHISFMNKVLSRDGPWPEPTQAFFWPAVNKRPTLLWPGYFLTRPEQISLIWREKLTFLGENFPNPNRRWLIRHNPSYKTFTRTGSKISWAKDRSASYLRSKVCLGRVGSGQGPSLVQANTKGVFDN